MSTLIFLKSGRYIEIFETSCKRSQTDPGLPDFGSRSIHKRRETTRYRVGFKGGSPNKVFLEI